MTVLTEKKHTLPNFLVIGAQKSATTSLHYYLAGHPEISMSLEKELDFFIEERNWYKGINWYQSQFQGRAKVYGESSPNYTNYPQWKGVPEKIYALKPDMKLIYILREPLERIISHYVHNYDQGRENLYFSQALSKNNYQNEYIYRSSYHLQLQEYLKYFSPANILIITTEKLSNYPIETLGKICDFLGVSKEINSIQYNQIFHSSLHKRRKNKIGNIINKTPLIQQIDLLPACIRYHLKRLIFQPFSQPIEKPVLTQKQRKELINLLADDINQLRQYTCQTFDQWSI